MKPSFALNITDSTIGLLHRTARGWLQVGETAFDTEDLAEALGYLRGSALGLSPGGLTTKLIVPNSQIKYLELDAPGPDDANRRTQIRAALVGRTPYNVEDLVFDWCGSGPKVQVAVVARETLDEAEAFAAEHRFNPVSFVGMPPAGDFKGEPWFGPTKISVTLLEKGEKVDRDADAVQVAARDLPKPHPSAAKPAIGSSSDADDTSGKPLADGDKPTRAQRRAAAAAAEQARVNQTEALVSADPAPPVTAESPNGRVTSWGTEPQDLAKVPDAFPEVARDASPSEPVANARFDEIAPMAGADSQSPVATTVIDVAATVPQMSVTDDKAFPEVSSARSGATDIGDDLPPAPSAAMMAAFASRRAIDAPNPKRFGVSLPESAQVRPVASVLGDDGDQTAGKTTPPPLSRPKVGADMGATRMDGPSTVDSFDVRPAGSKPGLAKANTAFVTAPNIPGSRKRKSLSPDASTKAGAADARKSLTKPGGTFASSKDRGKPRYLGLILTGLLLLFLALIAAWSSFFMASNDTGATGTAIVAAPEAVVPDTQIADAVPSDAVPAVDEEMLADSQDPAALDAANPPATDDQVDPAAEIAADVQPDAALVAPASVAGDTTISTANPVVAEVPDQAPVTVATTDSPSAAPLTETQDEIFLTAVDTPPAELDPLALPTPVGAKDALPVPQLEPPPFGTVYQFDAAGRIRPTPEGIITPEGVRLVAGKPSVVPPVRPEAVVTAAVPATGVAATAAATPLVAAAPVPFPSDPALADARPRARPKGLAPQTSGQADGTSGAVNPANSRLAGLRPLQRPAAVLAAGEAARQSTAAASLTAQAEQAKAVEAAVQASLQPDTSNSPLAVAVSRKPAARPKDMSRAVEAAVAVAVREPEPSVDTPQAGSDSEPELASVAPSIPTRASVAKQATYVNAINLSKINLIGVYGSKSNPYALIRQANGRYKKVKVGDSIDGGKVAAIGASEVRYQKSGRMISLKLPRT